MDSLDASVFIPEKNNRKSDEVIPLRYFLDFPNRLVVLLHIGVYLFLTLHILLYLSSTHFHLPHNLPCHHTLTKATIYITCSDNDEACRPNKPSLAQPHGVPSHQPCGRSFTPATTRGRAHRFVTTLTTTVAAAAAAAAAIAKTIEKNQTSLLRTSHHI